MCLSYTLAQHSKGLGGRMFYLDRCFSLPCQWKERGQIVHCSGNFFLGVTYITSYTSLFRSSCMSTSKLRYITVRSWGSLQVYNFPKKYNPSLPLRREPEYSWVAEMIATVSKSKWWVRFRDGFRCYSTIRAGKHLWNKKWKIWDCENPL